MKKLMFTFFVLVTVLLTSTFISARDANAQATCPSSGTYGKDVGRNYFVQVVKRLSGVTYNEFAVDALMTWKPYENTRAYWNPLATTWKMNPVCNFNSVGVQNYINEETGVRATANTLNLRYYNAIRIMMNLQGFDREAIRSSLGTWGTCSGSRCDSLLDKWQQLYNQYKKSGANSSGNSSCGSGDGIYLYEHINYEGKCQKFTGDSARPENWSVGNDNVSSIKIVGKYQATLYEHADFRGAASTFSSSDPDLRNDAVGNDRVSSIRIARAGYGSTCDGSPGVYLYEHNNYEGRCQKFTRDSASPEGWRVGNDSVSSIRLVGGYKARLFEHAGFAGVSSTFYISDPNLGDNTVGNDRASSLLVWR